MTLRVPHPLWILGAAIALGIIAACLGIAVPAYRQQRAIATIERLGGYVNTKPRGPDWLRELVDDEQLECFDEVDFFCLGNADIHFADWEAVSVLTAVKSIRVFGAKLSDVKPLSRLPNLQIMKFENTPLTVATLDDLNQSKSLQGILLVGTAVDEMELTRLDHLTSLSLSRLKITDTGLREIGRLSHLRALTLNDIAITDSDLRFLTTLGNLEYLRLYGTEVTDSGIAELQRALPKLKIER